MQLNAAKKKKKEKVSNEGKRCNAALGQSAKNGSGEVCLASKYRSVPRELIELTGQAECESAAKLSEYQ